MGDGRAGGLRAAIGLPAERVVRAEQVHGARVARVTGADGGAVIPGADALVTDEPGLYLMLLFADCVPVLLSAPGEVAIAHAGWQGTASEIARRTVEAMRGAPETVHVAIGPAIGVCCYEVSDEVADAVQRTVDEPITRPGPRGRPHLDLAAANRAQLIAAGLRPENVELSGVCTACNVDTYFSHRAEKGQAGRHAAYIGLPA